MPSSWNVPGSNNDSSNSSDTNVSASIQSSSFKLNVTLKDFSGHTDVSTNSTQVHIHSSLVAQTIMCLPTMWAIWVQSLGQEDLLEKEMADPFLPGKSNGWRNLVGWQRVGHNSVTLLSFFLLHVHSDL